MILDFLKLKSLLKMKTGEAGDEMGSCLSDKESTS